MLNILILIPIAMTTTTIPNSVANHAQRLDYHYMKLFSKPWEKNSMRTIK